MKIINLCSWLVRYLLWISVLYASVGSGLFHMAFWVGYRIVLVLVFDQVHIYMVLIGHDCLVFELDWLYISWFVLI